MKSRLYAECVGLAVLLVLADGPAEARDAAARPAMEDAAVAALQKRARDGDSAAQYDLANRYDRGDGVGMDLGRAFALFCRAAQAGHVEASYRLGRFYWAGMGTDRDPARAIAWLAVAADAGHAEAGRVMRKLPPLDVRRRPDCRPGTVRRPAPADRPRMDAAAFRDMAAGSPIGQAAGILASRFGLDSGLVLAVIAVESNFEPGAVSPKRAQGLMQLMPDTTRRFAVRDPFDPVENMIGGMRYLRWLLSYFRGDVRLALAAYNAGEGTVDRHGGIPPYAETREYVRRVGRLYGAERHPFDPALADPSPALRGAFAPAAIPAINPAGAPG
ncbi:transglycosylase SLT domain-containing protein [Azospirillum rugosum]|uniref:Transglycosylase SLT domain-containing protein n=1 Tax=Azospirillum rugosum TaxID=416170 RepID=A0ABS4SSD2_9PROT|nr:transglycosylase SLT domain-containing protein [Azospirillum rugosum]MBP2295473.1 hypothetical protein [Azospirillum rugosum]MDQ0528352.1 hypothetical protein [Azospirillum rugosum]